MQDLISNDEQEERQQNQPSSLLESKAYNKPYRQVSIRYGRAGCKCNDGNLHGHYWYAYWSEGEGRSLNMSVKSCLRV